MSEPIDAAYNPAINGVRMPDGTVKPWALAFPRRYDLILAPTPKN